MRIKNVLVRATVTGVLTATAGLGAAITATPANALPRQCTSAQIEQLQQDSEFWGMRPSPGPAGAIWMPRIMTQPPSY